jgi:hypothetical protein
MIVRADSTIEVQFRHFPTDEIGRGGGKFTSPMTIAGSIMTPLPSRGVSRCHRCRGCGFLLPLALLAGVEGFAGDVPPPFCVVLQWYSQCSRRWGRGRGADGG